MQNPITSTFHFSDNKTYLISSSFCKKCWIFKLTIWSPFFENSKVDAAELSLYSQKFNLSAEIGVEIDFEGENENEKGIVVKSNGLYAIKEGQVVVAVDPKYYRPTEVDLLIGDPSKAMKKLGWKPKYDLKGLVKEMMKSDLDLFKQKL